jgi:hypothetical protein
MKSFPLILGLPLVATIAMPLVAGQMSTLVLSISSLPYFVANRQDIRVDIRATNVSGKSIGVVKLGSEGDAELNHRIEVVRRDGKPITMTDYGLSVYGRGGNTIVRGSEHLATLNPGQTLFDYVLLNQIYDMSKPGIYSVQIVRSPDPGSPTPVRSNTIEIAVR